MSASMVIIDERAAHQLARERAEDTGRPHGLQPERGGGWRIVALEAAYQPTCVCGAPADGVAGRLCTSCALVLSMSRGDQTCSGCGEPRARGETCSDLGCPSYSAEVS